MSRSSHSPRPRAIRAARPPRWLAAALLAFAGCVPGADVYEQRLDKTRREWAEAAENAQPNPAPDMPPPSGSDHE